MSGNFLLLVANFLRIDFKYKINILLVDYRMEPWHQHFFIQYIWVKGTSMGKILDKCLWSEFWHEPSMFQSVAVPAVDWHNEIEPPFSFPLLLFILFFSVITFCFSHRRSTRIKKFILRKLTGAHKNLRPRRSFCSPLAAILDFWGLRRRKSSARIKKLIL